MAAVALTRMQAKWLITILIALACQTGKSWPGEIPSFQSPGLNATISSQLAYRDIENHSLFYAQLEPEVTLHLNEDLDVYWHPVVEPNDAFFRRRGRGVSETLYTEELYWRARFGATEVQIGKQDPVFGFFSDHAPGIFAKEISDAYERPGVLGVNLHLPLRTREIEADDEDDVELEETVEQSLDLSVFGGDRTFLSRSLPYGAPVDAFGDPQLDTAPRSFAIAYSYITAYEDDSLAGPFARVAVRRLAFDSAPDEIGVLLSGGTVMPLASDFSLKPLAEVAWFDHLDGTPGRTFSLTASVELYRKGWSFSAASGLLDGRHSDDAKTDLLTLALGYRLQTTAIGNVRVETAFESVKEGRHHRNVLGINLTKDVSLIWP